MLELNVLVIDGAGLVQIQVGGEVRTNDDLDTLKDSAVEMWHEYCQTENPDEDESNYSLSVEVID